MARLGIICVALLSAISTGWLAPIARAAESITYEVASPDLSVEIVGSIEYFDGTRRIMLQNVTLPWRTTVQVAKPASLGTDGAEVRANWYTGQLNKFVMVRIYFGDTVRCENALDLGNAACYGSTPFSTAVD
ncbi:hypothetical protein FZI85_16390 [Mycobacterium sp. CBMA293]|nr:MULTISPECIES: hypothetical protein [unclassified Mycolicibacterium]MUL49450.1 hypothetical protein [Mycolicibacterium sp. CBMA 360]MUL57229.1 hypothetical protein [Mycolicibacterium sp. CBMA 335]MUL70269.1 hypothetical protein [Mycolicibacterium sp. CBMA 311]MUL92317.1 hypothetical protein [Mycolicibacterium sp. CBMA 230]MUM06738.1 hypothetical protein [Mycolicibacterium sp. CBMA 213]